MLFLGILPKALSNKKSSYVGRPWMLFCFGPGSMSLSVELLSILKVSSLFSFFICFLTNRKCGSGFYNLTSKLMVSFSVCLQERNKIFMRALAFIIHLPCHRKACAGLLVSFYVIQAYFFNIHMRPILRVFLFVMLCWIQQKYLDPS